MKKYKFVVTTDGHSKIVEAMELPVDELFLPDGRKLVILEWEPKFSVCGVVTVKILARIELPYEEEEDNTTK